jgi:ATP-dependent DNA ligase
MADPLTSSRDLVDRYKRTVASRYRGIKPDELAELPPGKAWASPKIDGELWLAVLEGGKAELVGRGERSIAGAPLLAELEAAAKRAKGRTVLAGELFAAGGKPRPRVGDVAAAIADGTKGLARLGWQAFDALEIDGRPAPASYAERIDAMRALLEDGKRASVVATEEVSEPSRLESLWQEWGGSERAEGMVVRVEDGRIYKVKPALPVDVAVVGFTTRADAPDEVRSLLMALVRPDGTFQLVGGLGNVGDTEARRRLLAGLVARECPSRFRHASRDGVLYRFVRPGMVLEVACTDAQAEDAAGDPTLQWALAYDDDGWSARCQLPGASLLHATLVRVRDDKRADAVDARVSQLEGRCVIAEADREAQARSLPASRVVRREVWAKETKGKLAVRKLLVWQTCKEAAVSGWPAWVVHFTDYSPDRKTPLERTVKAARDEAEARAIADVLVAENVKKGWEPAGARASSAPAAEADAGPAPAERKSSRKK